MTTNAILEAETLTQMSLHPIAATGNARPEKNDSFWSSVLRRDAACDGEFVFAVSSTGIYCRPSCPARRPRRDNVRFFAEPAQAEQAGYRACLRCRPKSVRGDERNDSAKAICRFIEQHLDEPITLEILGKE